MTKRLPAISAPSSAPGMSVCHHGTGKVTAFIAFLWCGEKMSSLSPHVQSFQASTMAGQEGWGGGSLEKGRQDGQTPTGLST